MIYFSRDFRRSFRSRRKGFTLLEALAAVMLFGLLMLATASLWNISWRASEEISRVEMEEIAPETVMKRLAEAIEASLFRSHPRGLYAWETKDDRSGNGEADEISFITSRSPDGIRPHSRYAPLEKIQISVCSSSDARRQLVLRVGPFTMVEEAWQREVVLLENVESFRARYWCKAKKEWVDSWKEDEHAPEAVRLILTLSKSAFVSSREIRSYQITARVCLPIEAKVIEGNSSGISIDTILSENMEADS